MEFDLNGNGDIGEEKGVWGECADPGKQRSLLLSLSPVDRKGPATINNTRVRDGCMEGRDDRETGPSSPTLIFHLQILCP